MGHPQLPTPIHCDNTSAVGIANNTVKQQRSQAMEMLYFWVADQVKNGHFDVQHHPVNENLANYNSKHHPVAYHIKVRPYYQHGNESPHILLRTPPLCTLRGCIGTPSGYSRWDLPLEVTGDRVPCGTTTAIALYITHALATCSANIGTMAKLATQLAHKLI